ncbi:unnamed protein product [Closterium sp. Yama58-4]|nr:unnamed protein product [Closterium sp. Yama58-4]
MGARRSASSGENPAGLSLINRRTAAAGSGRGLASRREVLGLNRPGRGPGGFKLDMGALQRSRGERDFAREAQEAQARRDKFAFFEKDCSRVLEHVYVGSDFVARSREVLKEAGITHVLNCVGFVCPEYFPEEIKYKTLWLQDNTGEDLVCVLYDVFDYIEAVRAAKGRVFIHCCQGISRSTSLVIAYLMWREGRVFIHCCQGISRSTSLVIAYLMWREVRLGDSSVVGLGCTGCCMSCHVTLTISPHLHRILHDFLVR